VPEPAAAPKPEPPPPLPPFPPAVFTLLPPYPPPVEETKLPMDDVPP